MNCESDDEVSSQNKNSQTTNSQEGGSQAGVSQAGGSQKESIRRKYGTLEQSKRDAALLVRTWDKEQYRIKSIFSLNILMKTSNQTQLKK